MNILQCLACAPASIAATGDPRALADYWRQQGIAPCSFLYEHANEPVKFGTNCLVDLSKKQDQRDYGNGYVLDIEPDDYLAVGVQLAAAVRAVNAATLPSAGGDGRATLACSLYDLTVQRERTHERRRADREDHEARGSVGERFALAGGPPSVRAHA